MKFILKVASLILLFLTNAYSETNGCQNINLYSKIIYCDDVIVLKSEIRELKKPDQILTSLNNVEKAVLLLEKKIGEIEDIKSLEKNFEAWKTQDKSYKNDKLKRKIILKAEMKCVTGATEIAKGNDHMWAKKAYEKCIELTILESEF
jgi:hypothetical protein